MTVKELKNYLASCDDSDIIAVVVDDNEYSNHLLRVDKSDDSKILFAYIESDNTIEDEEISER
jgi:hypothetical protein